MDNNIFKAKKGTQEYEEWLRQYREKRGIKNVEPSTKPNKKEDKSKDVFTPSSIKSKLKSSGISVPSGFNPEGKALSFKSNSNRAYKTLSDLSSNLQKLGWKRVKRENTEAFLMALTIQTMSSLSLQTDRQFISTH